MSRRTARRLFGLVAGVVAVGGVVAATVPAQAGEAERLVRETTATFQPPTQGDVCLGSAGGAVSLEACDGGLDQRWRVTESEQSRIYRIVNVETGRCLIDDAEGNVSTRECAPGDLWYSNIGWPAPAGCAWSNFQTVANNGMLALNDGIVRTTPDYPAINVCTVG